MLSEYNCTRRRNVTAGYKGLHAGYRWLCEVKAGNKWLRKVTAGYKGLHTVTAGYRWLRKVTDSSYVLSRGIGSTGGGEAADLFRYIHSSTAATVVHYAARLLSV